MLLWLAISTQMTTPQVMQSLSMSRQVRAEDTGRGLNLH